MTNVPAVEAVAAQIYAPCYTGLHVCGITPDEDNFYSAFNLPLATASLARQAFDAGREQFACSSDEPRAFVVDLCLYGMQDEDFSISRQMLEPFQRWARQTYPGAFSI